MRPAVFLAIVTAATPALAQEKPDKDVWSVTLGAGSLLSPTFEGDDDYRVSVLPNVQVSYGDAFFASVQEGVGYRVIDTGVLRAGPIARLRFSRDENGDQPFAVTGDDTNDLAGLGDISTSIELGGFVEYDFGEITISAEARQAASGHEGLVADVGARWKGRSMAFGPPLIWSIGPRLRLVDDTFNAAYFGVTNTQSAASGLPTYTASGGLHSYGLGATTIIPIDRDGRWTAVAIAGYDRLMDSAADSPLVRLRGDQDQATIGVFVSYRLM